VADDEEPPQKFDRQEVVALIGKHAKRLAQLANEHGCLTLHYFLQAAADQADRELSVTREDGGSGVS
jgi:hypothetical protein